MELAVPNSIYNEFELNFFLIDNHKYSILLNKLFDY